MKTIGRCWMISFLSFDLRSSLHGSAGNLNTFELEVVEVARAQQETTSWDSVIFDLNEPMEIIVELDHDDGLNAAYGSAEDSGNAASYVDDNDKVEGSNTTSAPAPKMGMVFDCLEDVKFFFKQYGKRIGFGIKVRSTDKRKDGWFESMFSSVLKNVIRHLRDYTKKGA
ncbi:hypothetical protein Syun_001329 [Stephania yunnanensis]|uniref:Uncharacterized protein n=1 Tax=Stephania yunnanensis TaxID=152371 RepID=A0AAP0LJ68_9MAGN